MLTSARRSISYPNPDRSDRPDIPAHILNLVTALELDVVFAQGTDATRIARPHMTGVFFWTTDTLLLWYDDGTTWRQVGDFAGKQLDYAQVTAPVGPFGAQNSEATSVVIITGNSVAYDGTKVKLEFQAPQMMSPSASSINWYGAFYRDATSLGKQELDAWQDGRIDQYIHVSGFDTPSAGNHTYSFRAWQNVTGGGVTCQITGGIGGVGAWTPITLFVTKV